MSTTRHYTINATENYSDPRDSKIVYFRSPSEYSFTFMLRENCLYSLGDPRYNLDLNKLCGISRNLSLSQCGTRIGWNCEGKTMAELKDDPWFGLRAYVEENNKRVPTSNTPLERLASVRPEIYYDGKIKFRPMTQAEIDKYKLISAKDGKSSPSGADKSIYDSGYNYVSEINVSISSRKDSNGNYLNINYPDMTVGSVNQYIKGSTRTVMPIKKPSSMGYYHYYPYFGGDYPLGCPHDMDIIIIHDY
jgi:hypothetical protein